MELTVLVVIFAVWQVTLTVVSVFLYRQLRRTQAAAARKVIQFP